jgi:hypothetical protein
MADKKYCIFQVQGGLGKHIAATAVAQVIKKAYPDRKLVVLCAWPELWANLPFVHRVYPLGNTQYFYEEFIDGKDSLIFANEPYFTTTHINKTHRLVESWCMMYGLEYGGEQPVIKINPEQKKAIRNFYEPKFENKPLLLLHTNGGLFVNERPFCWSRDMPIEIATKVAQHFKKSHFVMQITRPASPKIEVEGVFVRSEQLSNTELCGLVELTDKRLLIDSSLQHAACAFGMPSTVLWNATSSVIFGHSIHDNIQAKEKPQKSLPNSVYFDYQFDANENEYPYEDEDMCDLYNIDQIIASLEAQTNEPKKGFG